MIVRLMSSSWYLTERLCPACHLSGEAAVPYVGADCRLKDEPADSDNYLCVRAVTEY